MISSSWIVSVQYLGGVLQVELEDRILEYTRVPPWVKGLLLAGPSVGRRFNQLVRDRYPYRAIQKPENKQDLEALLRASLEEGRNSGSVARQGRHGMVGDHSQQAGSDLLLSAFPFRARRTSR